MAKFSIRVFMMALLIAFITISKGNCEKLTGKIDVAVIMPSGIDMIPSGKALLKESLHKLAQNHFEMGEGEINVAIVYKEAKLGLVVSYNFTDQENFGQFLDGWNQRIATTCDDSLRQIREDVFDFEYKARAKVVVAILDHSCADNDSAKEIREAGAFIYAIVKESPDAAETRELVAYARDIAGDPARVFILPNADFYTKWIDSMPNVREAILRDLCLWTASCLYEKLDRQTCKSEVWQPSNAPSYFGNNNAQCSAVEPNATASCTLDDCAQECDRRWPWDGIPNCTVSCNTTSTLKRHPASPAPEKMEYCSAEYMCQSCASPAEANETAATGNTTNGTVASYETGGQIGTSAVSSGISTVQIVASEYTINVSAIDLVDLVDLLGNASSEKPHNHENDSRRSWLFAGIAAVITIVAFALIAVGAAVLIRKRKRAAAVAIAKSDNDAFDLRETPNRPQPN